MIAAFLLVVCGNRHAIQQRREVWEDGRSQNGAGGRAGAGEGCGSSPGEIDTTDGHADTPSVCSCAEVDLLLLPPPPAAARLLAPTGRLLLRLLPPWSLSPLD